MKCDLVTVRTQDGVVLHGAWYEGQLDKPAVILLPGAAMNFYSGLGAFLPAMLAEKGFACLSINHRGHDLATAPDPINPRVIGGLYDCFEDCIHDISAMIKFLGDKGAT